MISFQKLQNRKITFQKRLVVISLSKIIILGAISEKIGRIILRSDIILDINILYVFYM